MKRKSSDKTPDEGVALRDWLGHSLPSCFPSWIEVYIALQPSYVPPTVAGIHCLYILSDQHIDFNIINQYIVNKQPVQLVVHTTNNAMNIVQHICPQFSTKSLHINSE